VSLPRALGALVAVLAASLALWPAMIGLTPDQAPAAALILLAIGWWATGALPFHLTSLTLFLLATVLEVAPPRVVFAGFASSALWLVFGGLVIGNAVQATGLGRRLARGLVACCDIALASADAKFGTTEVRLGLIPAVNGPYVVAAIGVRQARRLMLTGERIAAAEAAWIGLVHEVVPAAQLDDAVARVLADILKGGPEALAAAKRLARDLAGCPIGAELIDDTARRIAALRASPEAREGLAAFLDKRPPGWLA
jgi:hypothetical protein